MIEGDQEQRDPPNGFTDEQVRLLSAKLDRSNVKTREGPGGRPLSYIEAWHAIDEANRIFGFDGWTRSVETEIACEMGSDSGYLVTYRAKCTITVMAGDTWVSRDGHGVGHGKSKYVDKKGEAHESAIKEAESDAMKRALMTFGYPFGLALYDKEQTNVEGEAPPQGGGSSKGGGYNSDFPRTTHRFWYNIPFSSEANKWLQENKRGLGALFWGDRKYWCLPKPNPRLVRYLVQQADGRGVMDAGALPDDHPDLTLRDLLEREANKLGIQFNSLMSDDDLSEIISQAKAEKGQKSA